MSQNWKSVLTLDSQRRITGGSTTALADAIGRGADLRIYTEFRHNEHIDTTSANSELIQEVSDFRATYLLGGRWVAGIMTLRQPIDLPIGFGPRPSMSFFLYNQDGGQAISRPYLDGDAASGKLGPAPVDDHSDMPKYHQQDNWDAGTNAPSSNFVYDFEQYQFFVHDCWEEVLSHTADGTVLGGSIDRLAEGFTSGREFKLGIRGLCADLSETPENSVEHEVFIQAGPGYYYTEQKLFVLGTQPLVRVRPAIPMRYESRNWDFGWLMARTDGFVARWLVNPQSLQFEKSDRRHAIRWFVR